MANRKQIAATFAALADEHGGFLDKRQTLELLASVGVEGSEAADLLWQEMGLDEDAHITQASFPTLKAAQSGE